MAESQISVVIIDDHPVVRAGLKTILSSAPDMTVIGEGTNGSDALRLVSDCHPDVLVLDVQLPDLNGIEVMRQLHDQQTQTAIVILTVHDDHETILGLLEAGAKGYVLKDDAVETLACAVRAVAQGESWLNTRVAYQAVRRLAGETTAPLPDPLTPREREILCLLAQGLDNAAIAQRLTLTKRTVQNHVSLIYDKLDVTSRTEAVLYAIRHNLVEIPSSGDPPHAD